MTFEKDLMKEILVDRSKHFNIHTVDTKDIFDEVPANKVTMKSFSLLTLGC